MSHVFPRVAAEIVRLCTVQDRAGAILTLSLSDVPGTGSRSRGSAVYCVGVAFSWRGDLGMLRLANPSGSILAWTFTEVAAWAERSLGGWPIVVALEFNGGRLSPNWVGRRLQRQSDYMAAIVTDDLRQEAASKRAAVDVLAVDAVRRVAAVAAAAVLDDVAAIVDGLRANP